MKPSMELEPDYPFEDVSNDIGEINEDLEDSPLIIEVCHDAL